MFKAFSSWFQEQLQSDSKQDGDHTVELATAVLMFEIMRADDHLSDQELQQYEQILAQRFSLSQDQVSSLMSLTKQRAEEAADFQQFTRVINQHCDVAQKRAMLDSLWQVAYADCKIDPDEEHLIRRIADLLYLPHSQYIQSKLSVIENGPL